MKITVIIVVETDEWMNRLQGDFSRVSRDSYATAEQARTWVEKQFRQIADDSL